MSHKKETAVSCFVYICSLYCYGVVGFSVCMCVCLGVFVVVFCFGGGGGICVCVRKREKECHKKETTISCFVYVCSSCICTVLG